jgi:hypothetical protein
MILLTIGVPHAGPRASEHPGDCLLSATSWLTLVHAIVLADRTMQYASGISCRKQHFTHFARWWCKWRNVCHKITSAVTVKKLHISCVCAMHSMMLPQRRKLEPLQHGPAPPLDSLLLAKNQLIPRAIIPSKESFDSISDVDEDERPAIEMKIPDELSVSEGLPSDAAKDLSATDKVQVRCNWSFHWLPC